MDAFEKEQMIDLRSSERQAKELNRIAKRVQQIAVRDFGSKIAVIVVAEPEGENVVLLASDPVEQVDIEAEDE